MKKVIVIAGPTASGKSGFSVRLAKELGTEIISGDSIQVYRGLNIGSGKVTEEEMDGVVHHLLDIRDPKEPYTVADFQQMAREKIEAIDLPIIAGGTGLYLKACLYDYVFEKEDTPREDELYEGISNEALYAQLVELDPKRAELIHPNNRQRVMRSLTLIRHSGKTQSELIEAQNHAPIYDVFIAGCTMPRETLYARINSRVEQMFENGLVEEVQQLLDQGYTFDDPGLQGIGYKEFKAYFDGEKTLEEVKSQIQMNSRRYAKRQYTWLNHQMDVNWFEVLEESEQIRMIEMIKQWVKDDK